MSRDDGDGASLRGVVVNDGLSVRAVPCCGQGLRRGLLSAGERRVDGVCGRRDDRVLAILESAVFGQRVEWGQWRRGVPNGARIGREYLRQGRHLRGVGSLRAREGLLGRDREPGERRVEYETTVSALLRDVAIYGVAVWADHRVHTDVSGRSCR